MCIRDRDRVVIWNDLHSVFVRIHFGKFSTEVKYDGRIINPCLLYTSDAADERSSVDLGGRRIIKKKKCTQRAYGSRVSNKT